MATLRSFDIDHDPADVAEAVRADGGAILRNALAPDALASLKAELQPWIDATPNGLDDFTGRKTGRTGALVARSPLSRQVVMHPVVLDMAKRFLSTFTNHLQLHLTQVINIKPGQGTQPLHRDREAWGSYLPRSIEPQFNTLWALTDFTEENGATRVVPGSPAWEYERRAEGHEKTQAVMAAGSVLLYSGSVIHGGGENRSEADRTGLNVTYTLSWLRTEENQFLSCPPEVAKDLDPELQELLGYTLGNYALGYYSNPYEVPETSDISPPELALGRRPTRKQAAPDG